MTRGWSSVVAVGLLLLPVACASDGPAPVPAAVAPVDVGAMPLTLDIPTLGLHVTDLQMFGTGRADRGDACPPSPDVISWDALRPRPGQPGLARMIASKDGAFRRLTELDTADPVVITLSDGRRLTFERSRAVVMDTDSSKASLLLTACGASVAATVYTGLVP